MLERFRRKLVVAAMGRNLAVDLSLAHGAYALEVVERALRSADTSKGERAILDRAAVELRALWSTGV